MVTDQTQSANSAPVGMHNITARIPGLVTTRGGQTLSRVIKSYVHDRLKRKGEVEYSEVAVVVGTNVEEAGTREPRNHTS